MQEMNNSLTFKMNDLFHSMCTGMDTGSRGADGVQHPLKPGIKKNARQQGVRERERV